MRPPPFYQQHYEMIEFLMKTAIVDSSESSYRLEESKLGIENLAVRPFGRLAFGRKSEPPFGLDTMG